MTVLILLTLNKSKLNSYFADFEQVKNFIVILLTLNKLKKLTKLPWEKLDAYASFFLAMASCHWHSTLASQACEGLYQL